MIFFLLLLYNTKTCKNNKTLGTPMLKEALMWTQLRKKLVNLQKKSRVWSCPSLHIPQQPTGPCSATAEVKGKPLLAAVGAGAAPQSPTEDGVPACQVDASVQGIAMAAAPYSLCTVVNVILCHCLASARLGHLCSQGHLAPCPSVWMPKANRKAQKSEPHCDPSVTNRDNWRSRGGAGGWGLL